MEIIRKKNRILVVGYSYLFCQYEISHPSKEKNFLQNWEDEVKFIGNMTKTQNREANPLRWQKSTSLGIRVPGPEYRKMEHRETLWWGCCCKKRENHYVSRRWHPSFKITNAADSFVRGVRLQCLLSAIEIVPVRLVCRHAGGRSQLCEQQCTVSWLKSCLEALCARKIWPISDRHPYRWLVEIIVYAPTNRVWITVRCV